MMLSALKEKYSLGDGAQYEPNPDCKHCKGSGERMSRAGETFCICLFVDHDASDEIGTLLSDFAKKQRMALEPQSPEEK